MWNGIGTLVHLLFRSTPEFPKAKNYFAPTRIFALHVPNALQEGHRHHHVSQLAKPHTNTFADSINIFYLIFSYLEIKFRKHELSSENPGQEIDVSFYSSPFILGGLHLVPPSDGLSPLFSDSEALFLV
jgi:hypothetical protein